MVERGQQRKSAILQSAIALMEARSVGMVTSQEWQNLARAIEQEIGERIEWRTHDEVAALEQSQ